MRPSRQHEELATIADSRKPNGGQGRGRTADTTIFSRVLYQLSYLTVADLTGFEPATFSLTGR